MFCASFEWLWISNCLLVPLEQTERQRQRHQKSGVQSLIGCLFVSPEWHRRENLIPINADGLMVQLTVNIVNIVFVMMTMMIMMTRKSMMTTKIIMTMELIVERVKPDDQEHGLLLQSWVSQHIR